MSDALSYCTKDDFVGDTSKKSVVDSKTANDFNDICATLLLIDRERFLPMLMKAYNPSGYVDFCLNSKLNFLELLLSPE